MYYEHHRHNVYGTQWIGTADTMDIIKLCLWYADTINTMDIIEDHRCYEHHKSMSMVPEESVLPNGGHIV